MRSILKLLARLYPAPWRARYGAEYEALLDDATPHARDVFDVCWGAIKMRISSRSFVTTVLPCALAGTLVALGISYKTPVLYTSGTVVVQYSTGILSSGEDSAPAQGAASRERPIRELVRDAFADREEMERIIRQYDLYPAERAKMPLDRVIDKMRSAIFIRAVSQSSLDKELLRLAERVVYDPESTARFNKLKTSIDKSANSAFTVEFEYPDPHVAQMVDGSLISLLTAANLRFWQSAAAPGPPKLVENIMVMDAPTLPEKPNRLGRTGFGTVGALGGLVTGLIAAAVLGSRQRAIS